jgi:hypothetical protein
LALWALQVFIPAFYAWKDEMTHILRFNLFSRNEKYLNKNLPSCKICFNDTCIPPKSDEPLMKIPLAKEIKGKIIKLIECFCKLLKSEKLLFHILFSTRSFVKNEDHFYYHPVALANM